MLTSRAQLARSALQQQPGMHMLSGRIEMMGARMTFSQNEEIYGSGEPADYIYKVVSGAVRVCKLLEDGRRQVTAFHLPGEMFGLEVGPAHRFTAEAVSETVVLIAKRSTLTGLAAHDGEVARELWAHTAQDLQRMQDHVLLLGCLSAKERVAAFLRDMVKRTGNGQELNLPMPRQDIADYLGLTIETVSRTISKLHKDAAIGLASSRRVLLRDRAAMSR